MSANAKSNFYLALVAAIWFLLTCWIWTYFANVFISFPFGIFAFLLWRKGKQVDDQKERYKIIYWLLILGVVVGLVSPLLYR